MALQRKLREVGHWLASRAKPRCGALLYHRVDEPENDPFRLCVSPEYFAGHMESLALSGRALSVPKLQEHLSDGELPSGKIAVTFDDGYLDNLEVALPILEQFEIPATLFVTTGNLGQPFWWDRLANLILLAPNLPELLSFPSSSKSIPTTSKTRRELFDYITLELRQRAPAFREEILKTWESLIDAPSLAPQQRCQSEEELKRFAQHPLIEIGAHSVTHSRLLALPYEKQAEEIKTSADRLAKITGTEVTILSYPFGLRGRDFNGDTIAAAKESGITQAFAANRGVITSDSDGYALPRLWIHNRDHTAFQTEIDRWV
ncbi:MAG: polysaccharide deacetylase family protein [Verrucomicrobiales bacterium]|nr:polysaccharide deacetylase family protein [Verrucomicrobiales bacterium]